MPESISTAKHPVGIIIQHGLSRTGATRFWAFIWSTGELPDMDPWSSRAPDFGERPEDPGGSFAD